MPQIKVDYIVSFSSEHPDHPAANLLSKDICNKRWTTLEKGESSLSIVFQLEKSVQITSIHIGNYHSALVEVLVGRSESTNQQYEVLLLTSSFMNPGDSRNSLNISNVRTFKTEQLVQSIQTQRWDRVRVVCTQPYNRHVQYGLSFIHFFSSDTIINSDSPSSSQSSASNRMLGKFKLRDDCDSDDDLNNLFKPGELFAKAKKPELSTEAQIRQAGSSSNLYNKDSSSLLIKTSRPKVEKTSNNMPEKSDDVSLSRKCDRIMYMEDDDDQYGRIDMIIKKDRDEKEMIYNQKRDKDEKQRLAQKRDKDEKEKIANQKRDKEEKVKIVNQKKDNNKKIETPQSKMNVEKEKEDRVSVHPKNNASDNDASTSTSLKVNDNNRNDRKRAHSSDENDSKEKKVKLEISDIVRGNDCLRGVVFVISGYVNPKRGNIRDAAVALGAKYSTDWHGSCTHLICAFPNTPKHDQVKRSSNGGIVVTAEWIEDCSREKAHLPWKWYATDPKLRTPKQPINVPDAPSSSFQSNPIRNMKIEDDEPDEDDGDTDDDIERIMQLQEKASKEDRVKNILKKLQMSDENSEDEVEISEEKETAIDPYQVETDSDPDLKNISNNSTFEKVLLDHFWGIKFYVDPNISVDGFDVDDIKRHIVAYQGEIKNEWPDKTVDVAVTTPNCIDRLREEKNKKCNFLIPEWIWKCHETESLYSYEEFVLI